MLPLGQNTRGSYRPLSTPTSHHTERDFDIDGKSKFYPTLRLWNFTSFISLFAIAGWTLSIIFAISLKQTHRGKPSNSYRLSETSYRSPLIDVIPGTLREVIIRGTFDAPSPFRGEPSALIDQEWENIHHIRPLNITIDPSEIPNLTDKQETAVRNAPEYGGGLLVLPEFSHHLHCMDLMRKVSYFKFDYYRTVHDPDFTEDEHVFKTHIDHCIEILRQFVMCHADVGLVTSQWVEGHDNPWPDFNTKQVCRDFDGILAWTKSHEFPVGTAPMSPTKPLGAKSLYLPP